MYHTENLQRAVWAKDASTEMNVTLGFRLCFNERKKCTMRLLGETCYKLIADGEPIFFGPNRAAHGYSRVAEVRFAAKTVVVESYASNVLNFDRRKATPYFACDLQTEQGESHSAEDFTCYLINDRVKKVQRYSFQRGFVEVYRLKTDRSAFYCGEATDFPVVETERVSLPKILPSRTHNAVLEKVQPLAIVDSGVVGVDKNAEPWEDRCISLVGSLLEGFTREQCETLLTDEVSRFTYHSCAANSAKDSANNAANNGAEKHYQTADFGRIRAGFVEMEIEAKNAGSVYVGYDEIFKNDETKELYPFRNGTANVFKWTVEEGGKYRVSTYEPYAFRYARIVCDNGIEAKISMRSYENPDASALRVESDDARVLQLVEAARATFAHNAVDVLTDCPGRERAGWLSDSWFSSVAEHVFTGDNKVERAFLENFVYADVTGHPKGMIPRCYPSDYFEENGYIPNWAMWYILELYKYFKRYGKDEIVEKSLKNVEGLLQYFEGKENEYGVLENLEGWIFVEWSAANWPPHICGVNVPSNACYYAMLKAAAIVYGEDVNAEKLYKKADAVKAFLTEKAYVGEYFVDNLVRDDGGNLVPTENYTEVCQYYMFWFKVADEKKYAALFDKMLNEYGKGNKSGSAKIVINGKEVDFAEANMMYGVYMRLDLCQRTGKRKELFEECIRYFYDMTKKTGTLWEKNDPVASCDHGFASYVIKWLLYALIGYDALNPQNGVAKEGIGIDCKFVLPTDGKKMQVEVCKNAVVCKEV